jgi:hypothetical protein
MPGCCDIRMVASEHLNIRCSIAALRNGHPYKLCQAKEAATDMLACSRRATSRRYPTLTSGDVRFRGAMGAWRASNARLGARAWLLDSRRCGIRGKVRRRRLVGPAGADANPGIEHPRFPGIEHPRLLHPAVWTRHQVLDRRPSVAHRVLVRRTRRDGGDQRQENRACQ